MKSFRSGAVGAASQNHLFESLFKLYDVQKNKRVCRTDFDMVHSLAQQLLVGEKCDMIPVNNGPNRRSLRMAEGSIGKKSAGKPYLLQEPFSEEYGRATFNNIDLDSDGCISPHDFYTWLKELMDRMSKCSGQDRRSPLILIKHVTYMLPSDKRFVAYRSLALSAKRAAEQDNPRQLFVAIAAFQEALGSAEGIIEDDDVLRRFQCQLTARQLDLKEKLQAALAAAETLHGRESVLDELAEAKGLLLLDPTELRKIKQYADMVKASQEPFTVHVSTLAGPEAHVEVSHEDSVWILRKKAAAELKQVPHAYQVRLTNVRGELKDDSAALRECLLCCSQGEEMVATYAKADPWVELVHPELREFRCKEWNKAACLHRAVEEAKQMAQRNKSEGNKMEVLVKKAEAYCHKTWQEATFEELVMGAAVAFGDAADAQRRSHVLNRTVQALIRRGLVET